MAVATHLDITGSKGGESKPSTPVEAPDSLRSTNVAKILLAVGEGEFDGTPTDRDIYLDNTPIVDASGNTNFPGVKWEWRRGTIEQEYIQGIPAVENETTVGVELRSDNPFSRALSDTKLSAVRVRMAWPRLLSQDTSGNTNGYRVEYAIDIATDGGSYVEAHRGAVDGKTSTGYQRSVRINLPKATSGWMMRVRRITPNANVGTIADTMNVAGYTEIIDEKLRYPNTALLYVEFDAQQFQNIPAVTVKCKAKRWPVPSNYDPIGRTYTGVWDGSFKQAWTNNPAFVTYGLCVEDRFGLGKRIKPWMVDKWEMYRIAQYCDQQVPNGVGGQEPRFLCDINLQGRSEAWVLLRDLSAIYRGMVYWAHGSLFMQADMPRAQDIDYVFTRANVIDGEFVYGGAERNTHYSRALVSYDNPSNNYDTDVIPVTDVTLQRRYRDRPVEISAIGCTRASEAQRRGKWALLSNNQDRTVTFKTGMEGRIPLPGYVIPVADELVAGRPNGGRISASSGKTVTLDRDTPIKAGDRLIVNLPNGTAQARTVQSVSGRVVTVTTAYSAQPQPQLQWAIDYSDLAVQLFRVLKTTRTQEGQYEISALEFNPSKFSAIDTGAKLDERPISVIPVTTVQPPASVTLTSSYMIDQGITVNTMTIAWAAVTGAAAYEVDWRKDNGNWIRLQRTGATSVDVTGIYAGAYLARVRAVSAFDISSIWKSSILTQLTGKKGLPPAVTSLSAESLLFAIGLKCTFPPGAEDTQRTELWYSAGSVLAEATKLADLAYPQDKHTLQGLRAGQRFFFWARLVDRSGNVGPWFPSGTTLVTGQASADAGPILEQIKDQITESELGKQLTSKIEKIALIDGNGPGSVNERVGSAKTELAKQISDVNNALSTTKTNLQQQITAVSADVTAAKTDLQQQIANVSALAGSLPYRKDKAYSTNQSALGSDGKLYQAVKAVPLNTPPPNATYWTDVGQAVVTAAGTAARVQTVETKVETLEGSTSAQAQQIVGLQSSLTATDKNVTAAQAAADTANALAGGKGKVIIQAAAPAVADRLAQNLWIDTTGNANTPKRWTGSVWAAVTDKAATDAAAAAAGALALAQTKADASVVSNISTRVTDAEGKLSSQATRLDGMQTSIDGKASSQALQQVTSRVTATEDKDKAQDQQLTSQSQALTSLTDSVSKKADASTVQSLSNTVAQQGQSLTAQGQSLTRIDTSLGNLGASGVNLLPAEYSSFGSVAPNFSGTSFTYATVADATAFRGYALKFDWGTTSALLTAFAAPGSSNVAANLGAKRQKYIISYYAKASVAGHVIALYLRGFQSDGSTYNTPGAAQQPLTTEWARYSYIADMSAAAFTGSQMTLAIQQNRSGVGDRSIWLDRIMVEPVVNGATEPSTYVPGNSLDQVQATASAVTLLSGQVSKNAEGIKSTSELASKLDSSLTTTIGNVDKAQKAAQDANDLAGGKGKVIVQNAAPAAADRLAQNLWIDTTGTSNTPKRWTGSAWVAVTDKVATDAASAAASALSEVAKKADASALNSLKSTVDQQGQSLTAQGQSITALTASVGNLGASGVNLLPAEYSVFGAKLPDNMYSNQPVNLATIADPLALRGYALKVTSTQASSNAFGLATSLTREGCNMSFKRQKYILSYWARAEVEGQQVSAYARVLLADGASFKTGPATIVTLSKEWKRYSVVMDLTSADYSGEQFQVAIQPNRDAVAGRVVFYDRFMIEVAVNNVTEPSAFVTGNSFDQSLANAAATAALDAKVAVTEGAITSASGQITELRNSLGDVGGENLIYNPSFEKPGANGLADGWAIASGSGASVSPSGVASALNPKESAQRIDMTGMSASVWARIGNPGNRRIALKPGMPVTLSAYMRGTAGLNARPEIQFLNSSGSGIPGPTASFTVASGNFARISLSAVVPDGAVECNFFVTCYGTSAISTAFMEVDRAQFEQSSVMTGWRDNGQVVIADQSATSSAVDSLNSVVSQQAGKIDSASSRTTALENTVNSTSSGLATKASTAAMNTLSGRVTATETGLTAASNSVNRLSSQIGAVGGTGSNLIPAEYATFTAAIPSMHRASTLTLSSEQDAGAYSGYLLKADSPSGSAWLYLAASATDYTLRLTAGRQYIFSAWAKGSAAHSVAVRLRYQNSAGNAVEVALSSVDVATSLGRVSTVITIPSAVVGPASVVLYTQAGSAAGATWFDGFMLEEKVGESTAPSAFSPGTSTRQAAGQAVALSALDTQVTQQGAKIESEAKRTDGLYTSVGNTNAAVQTETKARSDADSALSTRITTAQAKANDAAAAVQSEVTARADADSALSKRVDGVQSSLGSTNASVQQISTAQTSLNGKVNASLSVRLEASADNTHYAAGFGIGLDNSSGSFQSSFVVKADRFVVMNPVGNGLIAPFAIQNGQVLINDALISNLAVQRAIVGSSIVSQSLAANGQPALNIDFNAGQQIFQSKTRSGNYMIQRDNGIFLVSGGVVMVEMSLD